MEFAESVLNPLQVVAIAVNNCNIMLVGVKVYLAAVRLIKFFVVCIEG